MAGEGVIIGVALVGASATVDVVFQPEGVDGERGDAAIGAAAQNAVAAGTVGIQILIG
ncbi:MAG TPA: hypothetical protein VGT44_15755 [Ktedonobacteraceae bacterium]|nr:hypothetical protein [Ktedonobacteraceae bacterium]